MGLIKTAILTGGGIYAVNKLARASENRNNQQSQPYYPPQNWQQDPSYSRGPWGPSGQPGPQWQHGGHHNQQSGSYNSNPQQRQYYGPSGSQQYQERGFKEPPPYYQQQGGNMTHSSGQGSNQNYNRNNSGFRSGGSGNQDCKES